MGQGFAIKIYSFKWFWTKEVWQIPQQMSLPSHLGISCASTAPPPPPLSLKLQAKKNEFGVEPQNNKKNK